MIKTVRNKKNDALVKSIEKKYGVTLQHRSDSELHSALKRDGLPSLSKLLKMTKAGGR